MAGLSERVLLQNTFSLVGLVSLGKKTYPCETKKKQHKGQTNKKSQENESKYFIY